jgi:tripartite-type tricarboxylate transporter receptor subunit TctC
MTRSNFFLARIGPIKLSILVSIGGIFLNGPALAESAGAFYQSKNITWIISAGAGGGYSSYARLFAPHYQKHIPGQPKIVIKNMPGAGGIRASNFLYSIAPKDGSTIGLVHSSVSFAPLYGIKGADFDPRKFNWVGSIATAITMCVSWRKSGVTQASQLFEAGKYVVGGTGAGSQMETLPALLNQLIGTKIRIISGYRGGNNVYIAMERGEVNGRCGGLFSSINATRPQWFTKNLVAVPIIISMKRSPRFPKSPAAIEFIKDDTNRKVLELALAPTGMDRPILLPPGVPTDRLAALRAAFSKTMRDPAFIADAKRLKLEIDEVPGAEVTKIITAAYATPKEIVQIAKAAMKIGLKKKKKKKSKKQE